MGTGATHGLEIGTRLRLLPPGCPTRVDGRLEIVVPTGAFGSGEHETTAACLEAIEQLDDLSGARVLDLGSGTGILGVAAVLLGARSATCVDTDPGAVAVSRHTAALNGVVDRVDFVHGELRDLDSGPFGVVLANLYADVLLDVAEPLIAATEPGAAVVLSGIAWEQADEVRETYLSLGCRLVRSRWGDEWVTCQFAATHGLPPPDAGHLLINVAAPSSTAAIERSAPQWHPSCGKVAGR